MIEEQIKDLYIIRFLPSDAACSVISENSTFLLRSIRYYRILEENHGDGVFGDKNENIVKTSNGGTSESLATTLIGSWTLLDKNSLDENDWGKFIPQHK